MIDELIIMIPFHMLTTKRMQFKWTKFELLLHNVIIIATLTLSPSLRRLLTPSFIMLKNLLEGVCLVSRACK